MLELVSLVLLLSRPVLGVGPGVRVVDLRTGVRGVGALAGVDDVCVGVFCHKMFCSCPTHVTAG